MEDTEPAQIGRQSQQGMNKLRGALPFSLGLRSADIDRIVEIKEDKAGRNAVEVAQ